MMPGGVAAFALGLLGAVFGLGADRLAARWPAHEDGSVRGLDWRTAVVVVIAGLAFWALPGRWGAPRDGLIIGLWFAALIILLATDFDQRLLPDLITLPLIPISLALVLVGWDPILADRSLALQSAVAAGLGLPILLGLTNVIFRGGLGLGDLKLAVSLGLMAGLSHLVAGLIAAAVAGAVVLVALLLARRITLRSYIPFGPVLIVGGLIAALRP
ncbi:MAG: hypothetical protein EPN50_02265 [Chloroflexota bacterium]|nr:MAG: hypothetical protein EPN50_02265 [Chloroflexota bacterium]